MKQITLRIIILMVDIMTKSKKLFTVMIILFLFLITSVTNAQINNPDLPDNYYQLVAIFIVGILLMIIAAFLLFGMGEGKPKPAGYVSSWSKIRQVLTRSTPLEKESEVLLVDHDFDGIKELDNSVPPWYLWLFYLTIAFAVYYLLDYHVFEASPLMAEEYQIEVKKADELKAKLISSGALITENTVTQLTDAASLSSGKQTFATFCVACHAADGGGLVGPNLTDDYWIHGGGIQNIFKTIKYGVPAKGMISWQTQLSALQIQEVGSYIMSLHGTKPSAPKEPQGDFYSPQIDSTIVQPGS